MAGGIKLKRSRRRLCLCLCLGVSYRAVGLSVDVQLDLAAPTKQAKPKPTPPIPHSAQPTHTHPSVTANPSTSTTTRRYIRCLGIGTAPDPHPFSTPRGRFPHPFGAACRESADRATALVRPSSEMHAYELWEGWTDGAIRARSTRACCRIDWFWQRKSKRKQPRRAQAVASGFVTAGRNPCLRQSLHTSGRARSSLARQHDGEFKLSLASSQLAAM